MELSQGQEEALKMLRAFHADSQSRVAIITGYAGVGKTTLIRIINQEFKTPLVLTPTGKAAVRVKEATGIFASTIHKFLYTPAEDEKTGALRFNIKKIDELLSYADSTILVDESSMIGKEVFDHLLAVCKMVNARLILIGDTFQLPPVQARNETPFSSLAYQTPYKAHLTEVIRQALDSPIIKASMLLREGKSEYDALSLLSPLGGDKLVEHVASTRSKGGVCIVHTNNRRHSINKETRASLGYPEDLLVPNEPLLVIQNNYNIDRYNGEVLDFKNWTVEPSDATERAVRDRFTNSATNVQYGSAFVASLGVEGATDPEVLLSMQEIEGATEAAKVGFGAIKKEGQNLWRDTYNLKARLGERPPPHLHANFGYALTCHKSQGSEWPEVLVVMEDSMSVLRGVERKRWLYTAVTRAKQICYYVYKR